MSFNACKYYSYLCYFVEICFQFFFDSSSSEIALDYIIFCFKLRARSRLNLFVFEIQSLFLSRFKSKDSCLESDFSFIQLLFLKYIIVDI